MRKKDNDLDVESILIGVFLGMLLAFTIATLFKPWLIDLHIFY